MIKKLIKKLLNRYGLWRVIHIVIAIVIVILVCALILELVRPVRSDSAANDTSFNMSITDANHLPKVLQLASPGFQELSKVVRSGLFKSATSLRDKPMADKTIERIKSQLKLQCIMEMNGEPVVYVNIEGVGLKKCKVGDSVSDLFTVLNISEKNIEISIVDHKVTLSL